MSSKLTAASKTVLEKNNFSDKCKQLTTIDDKQLTSKDISKGILVYDDCSTLVEVTVKAKGRKRTSTMVSNSPITQKETEEKRRPVSSGVAHHNWGYILREQNRPTMKQGLQQYTTRSQSSKSVKHTIDSKEIRKTTDTQKSQKFDCNHANKRSAEVAIKAQKKSEDHQKMSQKVVTPSATSLTNSTDSILVFDKGVQCGGIFDTENKKFEAFNPVRTLGFLMKELEDLVKDEKSNKILTHMEQVLFRIPTDSGKSTAVDLEAIALRNQLEDGTAQLEQMSKEMNAVCESLREENNSLQKQVSRQRILLEEAEQKTVELEVVISKLRKDSDEVNKSLDITKRTISQLNEENKRLKADLTEQTDLARQRNLEMQYLKLEKEKILVLSDYKDSQLRELHSAVKDLPKYISEQLLKLKESYKSDEDEEFSIIQGGLASSSPTSSRSQHLVVPKTWRDIANVSVSAVECNTSGTLIDKHDLPQRDKPSSFIEKAHKNVGSDKAIAHDINDNDIDHLEFVSLQAGESTTFQKNKDRICKETSQLDIKQVKEMLSSMRKNGVLQQSTLVPGKSQSLDNFNDLYQKINDTGTSTKSLCKSKRSFELKRKGNIRKRSTANEDISKILKPSSSSDPIVSNIKEQFQNIFEDMRVQSRMPVNVPSPARCFPHPDWSDSSLPSISGTSELNIVPSNDS